MNLQGQENVIKGIYRGIGSGSLELVEQLIRYLLEWRMQAGASRMKVR